MFEEQGVDVVLLTTRLDAPFTTHIEGMEEGVSFARIDSELSEVMKGEKEEEGKKETKEEKDRKKGLISKFKEAIGEKKLAVEVQTFKSDAIPAMVFLSEESRRVQEMGRIYGMKIGDGKAEEKLVLNSTNELVQLLADGSLDSDDTKVICEHIWDMASLSHGHLTPERMERFIERNSLILREYVR